MHEGHANGLSTPEGALDHLCPPDSTSVSGRIAQASGASAVAGFALMVLSPLCPALPLASVGLWAYLAGGITIWTVVPTVMAVEDRVITHRHDYAGRESVLRQRGQTHEDQRSNSLEVPH